MDLGSLVNENISKKMGVGLFAMYLCSKAETQETTYVIAAIAIAGIISQMIVDSVKAWKDKKEPA